MESWGPKGIVGINRELRDYLRVGAFPIYGNGGFIVDISKGARMYSLITQEPIIKLDPYWVTGFIDGEGSFIIIFRKNPNSKTGRRSV